MELLKRSSSLGVEAVSDVSCTICREAFVNTDEIIVLPACQHAFHSSCVLKWLSLVRFKHICLCRGAYTLVQKNTCPVCRECVEHPVPTSAPLMKTVLSVELDKAESSSEMNAGVM
jgi:E3 ubiquitin-protein ligase ATL4